MQAALGGRRLGSKVGLVSTFVMPCDAMHHYYSLRLAFSWYSIIPVGLWEGRDQGHGMFWPTPTA